MDPIKDTDMAGLFASITEISSAHTYKVRVDFHTRFRVWKTQILPGRLMSIRQEHSIEYIHRMIDVLLADGSRLTDRAISEMTDDYDIIIKDIDIVIEETIRSYLTEIDNIKMEVIKCK